MTTIENGAVKLHCEGETRPLWGSISHSRDFICATVSKIGSIGIDVEKTTVPRDMSVLLQAVTGLCEADLPARQVDQYRLWTLFEAYCKATTGSLEFPIPAALIALCQRRSDEPALLTIQDQTAIFRSRRLNDYLVSTCQMV
ncbi:4'-phosphopantetheinyl transferase superfamily protein [Sneathiella sp.]|uniref:4'-phosphopantetheinyl transferase family protein n=1 Tax=Sneathiella sp. TaxID=1964365 RepID=UPI00356240F7